MHISYSSIGGFINTPMRTENTFTCTSSTLLLSVSIFDFVHIMFFPSIYFSEIYGFKLQHIDQKCVIQCTFESESFKKRFNRGNLHVYTQCT